MGDFVRLDIEIDDLTFSHSYIATELCHEEISNLYLYKDETLLSLSEAYEKEYVNYDQLEYAWETYYLCKGYSKEYVEELKNLPIKLEEVTNKAIEFFPQFIENYNDNDYKLEISVKKYRYLIEKLINKLGNNAPYEVFKVNEIDIYENGEQINTVYVGYTLGEEDKIWLMISVSNDNSINYIRVLEQNETDYPYEEDYDFDLIGAKSEEFGYNDSNYIEVQPKFIINSESQDVLSAVYRFAVLVLQK